MADLHFPKACAYPGGWESELNTLGNLIGDSTYQQAFITEAGKESIQGDSPNDKRGIALCIIGKI